MFAYSTAPGVPYEVVVVAITSAGKGAENDYIVIFSEELTPSKSPETVVFKQINSTTLNITWSPLTLFEARGFPEYRVVLATVDTDSRRKRQFNSLEIITNNSFAIFTGLNKNTNYSVIVGVRTGASTGNVMSEFVEADPIKGAITSSSCVIVLHNNLNCILSLSMVVFNSRDR